MGDSTPSLHFDPGSFRDPDTRVFRHDGAIFRCLSARALEDWNHLSSTEFYDRITREGAVVATEQVVDVGALPTLDSKWSAVLKHETVPFISYPYEWPFGMLKDAALLQLDLTVAALDDGMTLKDATPYNIQWFGSKPRFIDLGSFTRYEPGDPWAGYRQFCSQFLYPLFLQAYKGVPYHPWLRGSLEGIEATHCLGLLSSRDFLRPGVLTHVYLQAKAQSRYEDSDRDVKRDLRAAGFGAAMIKNNIQRMRRTVERLEWNPDVHKPGWIPEPAHPLAWKRLAAGGIFVSNTLDEHARVARAMREVFSSVVSIQIEDYDNRVLVGGGDGLGARALRERIAVDPTLAESLPMLSFRSDPTAKKPVRLGIRSA